MPSNLEELSEGLKSSDEESGRIVLSENEDGVSESDEEDDAGSGEKSDEGTEENDESSEGDDAANEQPGDKPAESLSQDELDELRQTVRDQERVIASLTSSLDKLSKTLQDANVIPPENEEEKAALEKLEQERADKLSTLLEVMELNPKYEDVKHVVTRKRFDDIVEQLAKVQVQKFGGSFSESCKSIEDEIWGLPNPYKFMYNKIKAYHPDYTKNTPQPRSIHSVEGGHDKTAGGWTAKKIDAMDEDELDQVPPEVYQKYLRNELD